MLSQLRIFIVLLFTISNTNAIELNYQDKFNTSRLLDKLFFDYDPTVRPNVSGVTEVLIDINIRSMSKISELDMEFCFEGYFRQRWKDHRLAFKGPSTVVVNSKLIEKLWKPYTYIENSRSAHVHSIPSINKFLRLYSDGTVLYSMRVSVAAKCPMDLKNFPVDTQFCPIHISSFAYSSDEITYRWRNPIKRYPKLKIAQFDLLSTDEFIENWTHNNVNHTRLVGVFKLKRHVSYFLTTSYIPCLLVVFMSWIGFYIDQESCQDRISIGATSLLTILLKLHLEISMDMPKITYLKAIDYYLFTCYGFITFSIIEFAYVHYEKTKFLMKRQNHLDEAEQPCDKKTFLINKKQYKSKINFKYKYCSYFKNKKQTNNSNLMIKSALNRYNKIGKRLSNQRNVSKTPSNVIKSELENNLVQICDQNTSSSVMTVDKYAKIIYPCAFILFNIVYFYIYRIF